MSATEPQEIEDKAAVAKVKRQAAEAAKKAAAEVEEVVADAVTVAGLAKLDGELMGVETAGYALAGDWRESDLSPELLAVKIENEAAKERTAYVQRFTIDGRGKAAWAAKKIAEARTALEDVKAVMKAEVKRAERDFEGRTEFFESKLLAWAQTEPKDRGTKGSIRLATAGVRLEVRDAEVGGVRILDERALLEELLEQVGIAELSDLGIVEVKPVLVPSVARDFLEAHPGFVTGSAVVEERATTKKLVIVRINK